MSQNGDADANTVNGMLKRVRRSLGSPPSYPGYPGYPGFHRGEPPSPLDEMIELYVQARSNEEASILREQLAKARQRAETITKDRNRISNEHSSLIEENAALKRETRLMRKCASLALREGDVVTCSLANAPLCDSGELRLKIVRASEKNGLHYVKWDKKRKRWGKTVMELDSTLRFILKLDTIDSVERGDKKGDR